MSFNKRRQQPDKESEPVAEQQPEKVYGEPKETKSKSKIAKMIRGEVQPEEIKPPTEEQITRARYNVVAIVGNTAECVDFRAIVKRKNLSIKSVLTQLLKEWNEKNYTF
ncbi:MAG: hypothetical protein ACXVPD_05030 [Bacteroidia bacterium]